MKTKRLKRIKLLGRAHYHVISRISERRFYLGGNEKDMFCDMMERVALFSGIRILTYCIMDNHFHLLIEVPKRKSLTISEIKRKLPLIYRGDDLKRVLFEFQFCEEHANPLMLTNLKEQYERRMFDLSEFMKTLKQRFSIWYNRNNGDRKGTLWEGDRFRSVLVQSPHRRNGDMGNLAILTIAAYIELNAVRAGIANDPKDYPWCGYGAAVAGIPNARSGIGLLMGFIEHKTKTWSIASSAYRKHLFVQDGMRGGISESAILNVLNDNGMLSCAELLHNRTPIFTSGRVVGTAGFVSQIISRNHESFRPGQRVFTIQDGNGEGLCAVKKC